MLLTISAVAAPNAMYDIAPMAMNKIVRNKIVVRSMPTTLHSSIQVYTMTCISSG